MATLPVKINDGGRVAAGFTGRAGDCVCRAIAIAEGADYLEVYTALNNFIAGVRQTLRAKRSSARKGVDNRITKAFLISRGWDWKPTMEIGVGTKVHLRRGDLPETGTIIVKLTKHVAAVVDGVINDTYDPSRGGQRCVYGYFYRPENWTPNKKTDSKDPLREYKKKPVPLPGHCTAHDDGHHVFVECDERGATCVCGKPQNQL